MFFDENGIPVDPSKPVAKGKVYRGSYPVTLPSEVPARAKGAPKDLLGFIKQNALPIGALGATGAALDLAFPEAGIPLTLARAALMGGENVALNKELPENLGGSPDTSTAAGFALGALPEAATLLGGRGITKLAERRLGKRVQGATNTMLGKLDPEALPVREEMMQPRENVPYPKPTSGNELTEQTFAAQAPINSTIQAARKKYGAPIGAAYDQLKFDTTPIEESRARQLAEAATNIDDRLLSPAPKAQAILRRLKAFAPPQKEGLIEAFKPEDFSNPDLARLYESTGLTSELNKQIAGEAEAAKVSAPSLDELRELRQGVNGQLQRAQGGDVWALGQIQDRLDEELMPHLPENMKDMRRSYAGFIKRWSYRDQHALSGTENPQEVADWTFKDPKKAHDLFSEASPQDREQLRGQFLQYVYGPLNDVEQSSAQQAKAVRSRLAPYVKDRETAKLVLGPQLGQRMGELVKWPKFTADFKEQWEKNPRFREHFGRGMRDAIIQKGLNPDDAADAMVKLVGQQSPDTARLTADVVPQLPAPLPKSQQGNPFTRQAVGRHGAMLGLYGASALAGAHMGFGMVYQGAALASFLMADRAASFATASKLGLTRQILKAGASRGGYATGRAIARTLLNAGARKVQEGASEPVELGE